MAVSKIPHISDSICREFVDGTTDAYGRLFPDFSISGKTVIGLLSNTHAVIALQIRLNTNDLAIKFVNSIDMTPVANTTCGCNVYYI